MAKPINLNRARKARARAADTAQAAQNRLRFGRTKAERDRAIKGAEAAARELDGHRREPTQT